MNYAQTETQATCTNSAAATSVSTLDHSGSVSDEVIQSGVKKNKRIKKVNTKKKRRDLHQELTDKIIKALEAGVKPWACPWDCGEQVGLPMNAVTHKAYNGINIMMLWMCASHCGFSSNLWMTFKQAKDIGARVIKGQKGTTCIYYNVMEREDEQGKEEKIPFINAFTLFNVEQIEHLPEGFLPAVKMADEVEEKKAEFEVHERAEEVMKNSGATIHEQGQRAFFSPSHDHVFLPTRDKFKVSGDFYATAMHELTHWTGHKSRLNRDMKGRFGSQDYAFEELVAELGAAFISAELAIQGTVSHESYLANWLEVLKHDKKAIFKASSLASQAVGLLLDKK